MFQRSLIGLILLTGGGVAKADEFSVRLNVIDEDGKPVAGAEAALHWNSNPGRMIPSRLTGPIVTGASGKVVMPMRKPEKPQAVMVYSADRLRAGLVSVAADSQGEELTVTLRPTVRVKGELDCNDLKKKPTWVNAMVSPEGHRYVASQMTKSASIDLSLPPGKYHLHLYGTDVANVSRTVEIAAGKPVHDLGTIDMPASAVAKLKGKTPPEPVVSDVRGATTGLTLSSLRGKWVYLEFWGYWCGPCVAGPLPELIDLYELHKDHRDKFEILAVHCHGDVKTFADLDAKLPSVKEKYWRGKDLPFPVLLDTENKTTERYGVTGFPTGLLIDPEGNLVGNATPRDLEAKLPPLPAAVLWKKRRNSNSNGHWFFEPFGNTAHQFASKIKHHVGCPVELDEQALAAVGLNPMDSMPGALQGWPVSPSSAVALMLAPLGLGIVPSADGKKLLITKATPVSEAPTPQQKQRNKEHAERLIHNPLLETNGPLYFKNAALVTVVHDVSERLRVPIALDPAAVQSRKVFFHSPVTGKVVGNDLGRTLKDLFEPLGLTVEVRHEVLFVTQKKP